MWLTGPVAPRHVGSSQTRARTRVPCIGRQILNHCATREAPLFEILILMGKQNTPLDGHEADEIPEDLFTPDNLQALLECQINSGEEVLRKCLETMAVNTLFCSKTQQKRMLEVSESCGNRF